MRFLVVLCVLSALLIGATPAWADSFWSVFNIEGESSISADYVTYATLGDMLNDTNRTSVTVIGGFGRNVVGSGALLPFDVVPEPSSLALLGFAVCGVAVLRRRR